MTNQEIDLGNLDEDRFKITREAIKNGDEDVSNDMLNLVINASEDSGVDEGLKNSAENLRNSRG
ncbi:hypothetical protein ACFL1Q_00140 [Patescibacteria group bacterium]